MAGRIYLTGDTHRSFDRVEDFCNQMQTDVGDLMIILGDNGVNWYGDRRDDEIKDWLYRIPITFMMIRGNHDMRPEDVKNRDGTATYQPLGCYCGTWNGRFLIQPEYPELMFAIDGESYAFRGGIGAFVIGGAYSIDKPYRLANGFKWFPNEQLSQGERVVIGRKFNQWVKETANRRVVLTHTCPYRFIPNEMKLKGIPRDQEDLSTERWMDVHFAFAQRRRRTLEWYCGHWHTDKQDGPVRFMYKDIWRLV